MSGCFKIHISYKGIHIMMRNVTIMRVSPVNMVKTKTGDTYVISQGDRRSNPTPVKESQLIRILVEGLAFVK